MSERRIDITEKAYQTLYDKKRKDNDYFVCTVVSSGGKKTGWSRQMVCFDTMAEAREFNNSVTKIFDVALNV